MPAFSSPPRSKVVKNTLLDYSSPPPSSITRPTSPSRSKYHLGTPPSCIKLHNKATYGGLKKAPHTSGKIHSSSRNRFGGSPLREVGRNHPSTITKRCSGNRVVWTKGTPSKCPGDRSIRRLTRWEKHTLFEDRPDLDPSKEGGFDMNKWMNGEQQEEEEHNEDEDDDMLLSSDEESESEDEPCMDVSVQSSEGDYHDAVDEAEDGRWEKENNRDGSFLQRLMQVGK